MADSFKRWVSIMSMLGLMLVVVGCQHVIDENTQKGTIKLSLTDAPVDSEEIDGVYVTITGIEYHINDEWVSWEGFAGPQTFNLMDLRGGNFALLGDATVPAGHCTQIRFKLDIPHQDQPDENTGCYISYATGSHETLFVPSGGQTGYKAVGEFDVPVNGTVGITADFDLRKAVVLTGSGRYILKPTIRLVVNDEAGKIQGAVTGTSNYNDLCIYAYEDGTYNEDETVVTVNSTPFMYAVNSTSVSPEGTFILPFLAAGSYDLVVCGYEGAEFKEVLGFVPEVSVSAGGLLRLDIDLGQLESAV